MRTATFLAVTGLAAVLAGCDSAGANRVLAINATGTIRGLMYLDLNGNQRLDDGDPRPGGARLELLASNSRQRVASAVTTGDGTFVIEEVPVGSYRIAVDREVVGDSLEVRIAGGSDLTLEAGETQRPIIALSFMTVSVPRLRTLPVGRRVFVEGIALNSQSTFDDATVHIATDSGAIRATRVRSSVSAGDSVRLLGRVRTSEGQTILDDVQAFVIERRSFLPPAVQVTTAQAASADGGRLDAASVRVRATVRDTATVAENFRVAIDDGSGPVIMVIDRGQSVNRQRLGPGAVIDATGLLIPLPGGGTWFLRPVRSADIVIVQPAPPPPPPGSSM